MNFEGNSNSDKSLAVLASWALVALLYLYLHYRRRFRYWTERGIPGPKPSPLIGNLYTEATQARLDLEVRWRESYGKVYGTFRGTQPILNIADVRLLRQIAVSDFDAFTDHGKYDFLNKYQQRSLFFLLGADWKRVRTLMTPTFTSGKIKRMFRLLSECSNELMNCARQQLASNNTDDTNAPTGLPSAVINVKDLFNLFTMDTISTCCFGLKLERAGATGLKQAAARDRFVSDALKLFDLRLVCLVLGKIVPRRLLNLLYLEVSPERQIEPFVRRVASVIQGRRKSGRKFDDYLQLLIDAQIDDELDLDEMDAAENHHAGLTHESILADQSRLRTELKLDLDGTKRMSNSFSEHVSREAKLKLTDLELLSNAVFLLSVGFESTGSLLTNCSYSLAFHPDAQERLHDELGKIAKLGADGVSFDFGYEDITKSVYLDCVICETLRMQPPLPQTYRQAVSDYYLEDYNLHLPKGSLINLALHSVHNDPDYWHQPERFNPDRFLPENRSKIVPGSYCPFGLGPRHCIGMRFSLTEVKLALAKMLMQFQFSPAPNTSFPPKSRPSIGVYSTPDTYLLVTQRAPSTASSC